MVTTSDLKQAIINGLNLEEMSIDDIDDESPLFGSEGLGLDSVDAIELTLILEKNFIEISSDELVRKIKNINYENILVWNGKVRLSIAGVGKKLPVMIKNKKMGFGEGKYASTHILKFDKKEEVIIIN